MIRIDTKLNKDSKANEVTNISRNLTNIFKLFSILFSSEDIETKVNKNHCKFRTLNR